MNNLLRTLTESQVRPNTDLRLLLTTVKEGRKLSQDAKLSDPFYDSLEGVLVDLRTVTLDNHDAEAFLKPVSKSEVPDYYDVISTPMDFQTMLKKVKQKAYKSKREFQDDLELIWSNCYTYNATENHPLRQCVNRLKLKSERLLKYITDRKDRSDPCIPSLPSLSLSLSLPKPTAKAKAVRKDKPSLGVGLGPGIMSGREGEFGEQVALLRSGEGMGLFRRVEKGGEGGFVRELAGVEGEEDCDDGMTGEKRKLSASPQHTPMDTDKPRKRARFEISSPGRQEEDMDVWWAACGSDWMLANGLPEVPISSSFVRLRKSASTLTTASAAAVVPPLPPPPPARFSMLTSAFTPSRGMGMEFQSFRVPIIPSTPPPAVQLPPLPHQLLQTLPKKRVRIITAPLKARENPKSMLSLMNRNIRTLKRLCGRWRGWGWAFSSAGWGEREGGGGEKDRERERERGKVVLDREKLRNLKLLLDGEEEVVDEAGWGERVEWERGSGKGKKGLGKGRGKEKESPRTGGIEIGEQNAMGCVKWMGTKVLEHAGFQGASASALDVLTGITTEYLLNVGRTIKFLVDMYGARMTSEELILHALFESGTSRIQDLERYIWDDVERHGARMGELEKKLGGALREAVAGEVVEDEGLFDEEDEEETGALTTCGEFADVLGEDFFGLRELGIADELGISNLSIPKKLWKRKKAKAVTAAKPTEPPPPYPPPAPFIPLDSSKIEDQIGLLKPYYAQRFAALAVVHAPPPSLPGPQIGLPGPQLGVLPGPQLGGLPGPQIQVNGMQVDTSTLTPAPASQVPVQDILLVLQDDLPSAAQVKMGPLGQILKPAPTTGTAKKKSGGGGGGAGSSTPAASGSGGSGEQSPKKKKGGGGTNGNGRKKRSEEGGSEGVQQQQIPAVVVASA
ncbi:hypothetical protein BDQ17DRAFT_1427970 [Cyathus striatus]|nr:hypothetical protein BDQ17DRAFT_1427970 [Cyathus striatus]